MTTRTHRRRSKVWLAFLPEGPDDSKATCRVCGETLGGDDETEKCTTSKLWKHVHQEHLEVFKMLVEINQDDSFSEGFMDQWNLAKLQKKRKKGYTSQVWKYFTLDETDKNISICCECNERISRGCDKNTSSMWNHLKIKHPDIHDTAHGEETIGQEEGEPDALSSERAAVQDQFLLCSTRQNSYICKTCGTIMRLESPDEKINTSRLYKHLDNIFHKRVQHGLEPPKRPILPKYYMNQVKSEKKEKATTSDEKSVETKKQPIPSPVPAEKIICNRGTDLVHSAVMMQTLYEQQKKAVCCDYTITLPHKEISSRTVKERTPMKKKDGTIEYFETESGIEFEVHSCVFAVASGKIRALIENGASKTIIVHDVTKEALLRCIEIVYLGTLKGITKLTETDILDLYRAAQSCDCSMVAKYLERECSHIVEKLPGLDDSENASIGKFSLMMSSDFLNGIDTKPVISVSMNVEENDASGLSVSHVNAKTASGRRRRKRKPLSSTFRFVEPKKEKPQPSDDSTDSEIDRATSDFNNGTEEDSYLEGGMKFEIQGDTAILRASPEFIDDPADTDFALVGNKMQEQL